MWRNVYELKRTLFSLLVSILKAVKCLMRWWFNGCWLWVFCFLFFSMPWKAKYLCCFFTRSSLLSPMVSSHGSSGYSTYCIMTASLSTEFANLDSYSVEIIQLSKSVIREVLFQSIDRLCMFKLFQTPWKRNYSLFEYRAATACMLQWEAELGLTAQKCVSLLKYELNICHEH